MTVYKCMCVSVGVFFCIGYRVCVCVRASFVHNNNYNLTSDLFMGSDKLSHRLRVEYSIH